MTVVRRFLVLAALMFWHGGFTFYSSVVIPVGQKVLGSHRQQALVTQSVTNYLNLAGAVALALWAWDIAGTHDSDRRRRVRWGLWVLLVVTLGLLVWLHVPLDREMIPDLRTLDESQFRQLHGWYLIVSTVQWAAGVILTVTTLMAWRCEDRS